MKAITLTQPWASLVTIGAKRIETRSWRTSYRGPIAIHAAKGFPGHAKRLCEARLVCRVMGWQESPGSLTQQWLNENARCIKSLPLGSVIAIATLVDCVRTESIRLRVPDFSEQEEAFGDYGHSRYVWLLEDIQPLATPIPAKGALSLWDWARRVNA